MVQRDSNIHDSNKIYILCRISAVFQCLLNVHSSEWDANRNVKFILTVYFYSKRKESENEAKMTMFRSETRYFDPTGRFAQLG